MPSAFVGMGSNIEPKENLRRATQKLRGHFPDVRFSSVYRTAARDYEAQAGFLNAVAAFKTPLSPEAVLQLLQGIEEALGKAPPFRFGPRTIDLDLLLYDDLVLPSKEEWLALLGSDSAAPRTELCSGAGGSGSETLFLPHLRMHERRFVLEPLCELLDPQGKHPVLGSTWQELLEGTKDQQCDTITVCL